MPDGRPPPVRGGGGSAGPGLSDILWRVVCAGEGMRDAETALGWPARRGRLVLTPPSIGGGYYRMARPGTTGTSGEERSCDDTLRFVAVAVRAQGDCLRRREGHRTRRAAVGPGDQNPDFGRRARLARCRRWSTASTASDSRRSSTTLEASTRAGSDPGDPKLRGPHHLVRRIRHTSSPRAAPRCFFNRVVGRVPHRPGDEAAADSASATNAADPRLSRDVVPEAVGILSATA